MDIILPEIVAIGIYNSQIAVKDQTITKSRRATMFEIEIPIEEGGISYINSEEMKIAPDMVICAKPEQIRHTKLPFKCYYIHMILQSGMLYDMLINTPVFIKTAKRDKYIDIFTKLCKYYNFPTENNSVIIHSLILELIYILANDSRKQFYRECVKTGNYQTIEKVIKYIKENITSDLSLETVAAYANLSPIHFHNCFKAWAGKTLHKYVEELRIKKAANLLITTDWTLARISAECGFSSQSYFNFAFKRKMNLTPREYAKEVYKQYDN